jgi:ferredoxin
MALRIEIDRNLCIGAAPCVAVAGSVFQLDDEGKAIVIDPKGADDETIIMAAQSCPVRAITIYNEETGEKIFPKD